MFWCVGRIDDQCDSQSWEMFSEVFCIKTIVCTNSLDCSWKVLDESCHKIFSINNGIPVIESRPYKSTTVINGIYGNYLSQSSKGKTRIKLYLSSWFVICIQFWILSPSGMSCTVPYFSPFQDTIDGCRMKYEFMMLFQFLRKLYWSQLSVRTGKIFYNLFHPFWSSIIRTSWFWSWLLPDKTSWSSSSVLWDESKERLHMHTESLGSFQRRYLFSYVILKSVFSHSTNVIVCVSCPAHEESC